jgi:hypothetical protein
MDAERSLIVRFEVSRPLLRVVAGRLLSSAVETEDKVQEKCCD